MSVMPGTRRDRRALLVGAAVIGATLVVGRGLPALSRQAEAWRARAEAAALALRSAEREIELLTAEADPRALLEAETLEESIPTGATPTAAAAEALSYVSDLASGLGAALQSARPESDSAFRGGVAAVAVHVALTADAEAMRSLLLRLETGPQLFRVRSLAVTQSAPAAEPPVVEELRVELTVESVGRRVAAGRTP